MYVTFILTLILGRNILIIRFIHDAQYIIENIAANNNRISERCSRHRVIEFKNSFCDDEIKFTPIIGA